jgi:ribose transport system substrate-binding protein
MIGKTQPPYVALSALPVDHSNVLQAWTQVYHSDPPKWLRDSYQR